MLEEPPRLEYETREQDGKERIRTWPKGGDVFIHRLCAVAWFGLDVVEGKDVHHRLSIPWLNVESNLLPLPKPEHGVITAEQQRSEQRASIKKEVLSEL